MRPSTHAAVGESPGAVSVGDDLVQPGAGRCAGRRRGRDRAGASARSGLPATIHGSFAGTAQAYQDSLANEPILIAAALVAVYIVLGMLYESYIHPITILSTLPSAGVGALLALMLTHNGAERHRADRHHSADRHREEERDPDDRFRARGGAQRRQDRRAMPSYEACLLRFRPIMMTTMAALLGALPLALGHGRPAANCGGRWASRSSAG